MVPERVDRRRASLPTMFLPILPSFRAFWQLSVCGARRKLFSSSNLATVFNLLKRWKLPTAGGRMLSVLITVIASAFLPPSVCAPCSSAQR